MIQINKKGVYYLTQIQQSSVAMHHPEVVAAGAAQSHRPAQRHGCSSQDVSRRRPAGRSQGKKRVLQRHGSQHRKTYASTSSPRSQVCVWLTRKWWRGSRGKEGVRTVGGTSSREER